jgi:hypothetical protein
MVLFYYIFCKSKIAAAGQGIRALEEAALTPGPPDANRRDSHPRSGSEYAGCAKKIFPANSLKS